MVGTHAVIQDKVQFNKLALAIIDEQHRFGVAQRLALRSKLTMDSGEGDASLLEPHLLMMTATPIPRTLAMSYYADLDVSTIDELPPGRTPIITKVVNEARRDEVMERIRVQLAQGRQVYWVCPLIEESEALDLTNATETHARPERRLAGGVMVGLLHSRMPVAEKRAVMALFTSGEMGVLVSTTVIEVGVDVPNASLMVIEHAERFGLIAVAPVARPGGAWCGGVGLCAAVLHRATRRGWARPRASASRPWWKPTTALRLPGATWRFAAPASFWAPASRVRPCCALPTWRWTPICWTGRATWRR